MLPPQPPPVQNGMGQGNDQERAACHPDVTKYCQVQLQVNPNDVLGIPSEVENGAAGEAAT